MISAQRYRKTGIDLKIAELNPAYSPQGDSVFAEKTDRIAARNDVEIPEGQIADVNISGAFSAEIGIRMRTQNRRTVSPECYAAEPAVPDCVIAGTTNADALTGAVQQTVGHGNIFTDGRNVFIPADRTENQTVISGSENTVTDHNIAAAVNINSVIIDHLLTAADGNAADEHIFTGSQPAGPPRRVNQRNILNPHIAAAAELNKPGTRPGRFCKKNHPAAHCGHRIPVPAR